MVDRPSFNTGVPLKRWNYSKFSNYDGTENFFGVDQIAAYVSSAASILFTDIPGLTLPDAVEVILTVGHSVAGKGGATYARTANIGAALNRAQTANGVWLELVDAPTLQNLGVLGDGSIETAKLQAILTAGFCVQCPTTMRVNYDAPLWGFKVGSGFIGPPTDQPFRWSVSGGTAADRSTLTFVYVGANAPAEFMMTWAGNSPYGNSGLLIDGHAGVYALESVVLKNVTFETANTSTQIGGIRFLGSNGAWSGGYGTVRNFAIYDVGVNGNNGIGWLFQGGVFDLHIYNPVSVVSGTGSSFKIDPDGSNPGEIYVYSPYAGGGGIGWEGCYNLTIFGGKTQTPSGYELKGFNNLFGVEHESASGSIAVGSFGIKKLTGGPDFATAKSLSWIATAVQIGDGSTDSVVGYDFNLSNIQNATTGLNVTAGAAARRGKVDIGAFGTGVATQITNNAAQGDVAITLAGQSVYTSLPALQLRFDPNGAQVIGAGGQVTPTTTVTPITSAADVTCADPAMLAPVANTNYYVDFVILQNTGSHVITLNHSSGFRTIGAVPIVLDPAANKTFAGFVFSQGHWNQVF